MPNAEPTRGLLPLAILAAAVGAVAGLVGAGFRLLLIRAEGLRGAAILSAHDWGVIGFLGVVGVISVLAAVAASLVRRLAPDASGSGIPHVEAVLRKETAAAPLILVPVKFFGGIMAIGSGLALGREGPSVQMGATLAHLMGRLTRRDASDCLALLAAGAGAGLATAFNSPIGGAVFVLEELVRRFDTRITIATFAASAAAISVSRVALGDAPDFAVAPIGYVGFAGLPIHFVLGAALGLIGVAYSRTILGCLAATDRLSRWPVEARAAAIGAAVGVVAWFAPQWVGGGDPLTQATLSGSLAGPAILAALFCRFLLGPVSYAAKTPGGLFAPLLVIGAQIGALAGLASEIFATAPLDGRALAVVGMAAFFTAVVRAPLTGIVLVIEMTGTFTLLLPMLCACFPAMLVPTLLGEPPIYDSLSRPRSQGD
ncbi:MAG: ClC family H(+)/Cl(-) exchange transporter [Planctomycetota bacterium]